MAQGATESGAAVALESAEVSLAELVDIEDYYFGTDKEQRKQNAADTVVMCADTAQTCMEVPSATTNAKVNCIKGQALSFIPGREKEAVKLLSKALKLDPHMVDAWNALGEVYWNEMNYTEAKSNFEQALELCGRNSTSLRNLSMVLRALDGDGLDKSTNYANALKHAKEATVLDANNAQNWETLGNAYMGEFFVNGKRYEELNKALVAYARAEAAYEKLGKRNPTLHMNRGTAAKFLEDYDLALRSFQIARDIGAPRGGEEYDKVAELVKRIAGMVERRSDLKARRLKEIIAGMAASSATLEKFRTKENGANTIDAKVISIFGRKDDSPVTIGCCDVDGGFFALSIYNADQVKISELLVPLQTTIGITKPHYRQISVSIKGAEMSYPCVRVAHPGDVMTANGGNLGTSAVKADFTSQKASD